MPEGSSSEAPVISPGPRLLRKSPNAKALAGSTFASGLRGSVFRDRFGAAFLRFAIPAPNRRTNLRDMDRFLSPNRAGAVNSSARTQLHACDCRRAHAP